MGEGEGDGDGQSRAEKLHCPLCRNAQDGLRSKVRPYKKDGVWSLYGEVVVGKRINQDRIF